MCVCVFHFWAQNLTCSYMICRIYMGSHRRGPPMFSNKPTVFGVPHVEKHPWDHPWHGCPQVLSLGKFVLGLRVGELVLGLRPPEATKGGGSSNPPWK